jgi:hypothetical protein
MIPKRNLFTNKLQKHQQKLVLLKLKFLIKNGLKMVSDFLYNSDTPNAEVSSVRNKIYAANVLDKFQTCQMALFTTKQLADYFYTMFFFSARWQMAVYTGLFHVAPFVYKYGRLGYSDPLSFDLSDVFAKQEKEEQAVLKCNTENQLYSSQHEWKFSNCDLRMLMNTNIPSLMLSLAFVLPLDVFFTIFCIAILLPYIFKERGRIFLM